MCLECGCHHHVPFGVKVLSVIAPGLLQAREPVQPAAVDASAAASRTIEIHASLLAKNEQAAARNRARFSQQRILSLNLVSSPGSGKTTLLSRTLDEFGHDCRCAVIVGDLETDNDARRIHRPHVPVAQITTGTACHLDAEMIARGLDSLALDGVRVVFIENVGNLVCPANFDLGETLRVVLLSAAEGEDKPLKYPPIFKSADLVIITKTDVAELLGFDAALAEENIRRMAPGARLIRLSAKTGEGMDAWYDCLRSQLPRAATAPPPAL